MSDGDVTVARRRSKAKRARAWAPPPLNDPCWVQHERNKVFAHAMGQPTDPSSSSSSSSSSSPAERYFFVHTSIFEEKKLLRQMLGRPLKDSER